MKTEWTLITQGISWGRLKTLKLKKDNLIVLTFILQTFNRSLTWEPKGIPIKIKINKTNTVLTWTT